MAKARKYWSKPEIRKINIKRATGTYPQPQSFEKKS